MGLDRKELLKRYVDVWNGGELHLLDHFVAADFQRHVSPTGGPASNLTELKNVIAGSRADVPDLHLEVEDVMEVEGRLVCRWTSQGTHREGREPPDRPRRFSLDGITLLRFEDGKIAEEWSAGDELGALLRLGFRLEPPGKAVPVG
ncbi:MAG: ester cyclase [Gemmatimonadota bacterium]